MSDNILLRPTPARIGSSAYQLVTGAVSLARKVIHELVDDIDGDAATETVRLSYRGVDYEVDLSARNAAALDEALAPYLESARRVPRRRTARRTTAKVGSGAPDAKDVRRWARSQGIEVSERGRVRADVTRRYREAHGA
jgi:hypothetical protein